MESKSQIQPKIFIGGLSNQLKRKTLLDYLQSFGEVEFLNIMERKITKKRLGFAFARFKRKSGTIGLISLPGHRLEGRKLEIQLAKEKHEKKKYINDLKARKIFIKGLPKNIDQFELEKFFEKMGKIRSAYSITDHQEKIGKGYGFVVFEKIEIARKTLSTKNFEFMGRTITCLPFKTKNEQKSFKTPSECGSSLWELTNESINKEGESLLKHLGYTRPEGLYEQSAKPKNTGDRLIRLEATSGVVSTRKKVKFFSNTKPIKNRTFEYLPRHLETRTRICHYEDDKGHSVMLEFVKPYLDNGSR